MRAYYLLAPILVCAALVLILPWPLEAPFLAAELVLLAIQVVVFVRELSRP